MDVLIRCSIAGSLQLHRIMYEWTIVWKPTMGGYNIIICWGKLVTHGRNLTIHSTGIGTT